MDEYIKKNQALCCFRGWIDQNGDFHEPDEMIEYQRIEQLSAADVVPVVRGRWNCSDDVYENAVCSVCGWDTAEPWAHVEEWFAFCPNCGARMDGEHGKMD